MKQQIRMFVTKRLSLLFLALAVSIVTTGAFNNQNNSDPDSLDPGVRGGPPAAGGPEPISRRITSRCSPPPSSAFQEVDSVSGTHAGEAGSG